jgi:uncharacterized protein YkwD
MGCENCINSEKENEILKHNETKTNSNNFDIITDLEKNETTNSKEKTDTKNKKLNLLNSSSKEIKKMQKNQFNVDVLNEINLLRTKHGVAELKMDKNICIISQKYAEKMARESELELSGNKYNGEDLGEIIFSCQKEISPKDLVELWYYKDSENYNYKKEPTISINFTQIIWKNSKLFGMGSALTRDNNLYIVANFYPMGNVKGQFLKNVFPLVTKGKSDDNSFYSTTTNFLEEALLAHNELRAKHNVPPLTLNPILSTLAQNHAKRLAKEGKLIYSNNKMKDQNLGENLFMNKYNSSGEEVSSHWYKGYNKYDFNDLLHNKYDDEDIKNFTQLIWKNTKEVGFGFSNDKKGNFYAVANYFPCGNIKGQYEDNVLPD